MSVIDRSRVLGFNAIGWGQDSLHGKETSNHALCYFVLLRMRSAEASSYFGKYAVWYTNY